MAITLHYKAYNSYTHECKQVKLAIAAYTLMLLHCVQLENTGGNLEVKHGRRAAAPAWTSLRFLPSLL